MIRTITNRCLALAGLFQAADLVRQVAREGHADPRAVEASLGSIFFIDSVSVSEIYGGLAGIRAGLQLLRTQLRGPHSAGVLEVARYAITLMQLEKRLSKRAESLAALRLGIERIGIQARYFSRTHTTVIAALAELYRATISPLSPPVIVHGNPALLETADRAELIRALLLAGMRSAVLWRQSGGGRWNLLFARARLLTTTEQLLADIEPA